MSEFFVHEILLHIQKQKPHAGISIRNAIQIQAERARGAISPDSQIVPAGFPACQCIAAAYRQVE